MIKIKNFKGSGFYLKEKKTAQIYFPGKMVHKNKFVQFEVIKQ